LMLVRPLALRARYDSLCTGRARDRERKTDRGGGKGHCVRGTSRYAAVERRREQESYWSSSIGWVGLASRQVVVSEFNSISWMKHLFDLIGIRGAYVPETS
jgi:hypothetical protein